MANIHAPRGYQQITSLSSATTLEVPTGSKRAVIVATGQAVRWRDDGTAPTSTVGMPLAVDTQIEVSTDLSAIQFIEQVSGAVLNVSYY